MRKRRIAIALVVAVAMVLLASSVLVGCGRRARQVTTQEPSVVTTQAPSESTSTTSTGTDQTSPSERIDAAKAQALDGQLNAIDSELGGVQMPVDSEFNDSAGALQ